MFNTEITIVLLSCRIYLQNNTISDLKTYIDTHPVHWDRVYELCARHRVRPVVLQVLCRIQECVPAPVLQRFRTYCRELALFNFDRKTESQRIIGRLREKGVFARVYKGMDFSQLLYHDLSLRECTDTDIIIQEEQAEIVMEVMKDDGYRMHLEAYFKSQRKHFSRYSKDIIFGKACAKGRWFGFEFHYRPTKPLMGIQYQFSDLLGDDYLSGRSLTYEDYYKLMLVNNGASDFYPSLRSLMDMVLLYRKGSVNLPAALVPYETLWKPLAAALLSFPETTTIPIKDKTYQLLMKRLLHDDAAHKFSFIQQAFVNITLAETVKAKTQTFMRYFHFLLQPNGHDFTETRLPYFMMYFTKPFRLALNMIKGKR
jgi:hypothetical protein